MGNPFVHIELATDNIGAAKKFYKSVFDWKVQDMPASHYTMIDVGKGVGGGMMKKEMPTQPTAWLPYVEVANVQKTLDKARKAGAQVVVEPMDIGDGMGTIGVFMDPTGAGLGVWAKPAKRTAPKRAAKKPAAKRRAKKKGARR